jgi:hypothetical protein
MHTNIQKQKNLLSFVKENNFPTLSINHLRHNDVDINGPGIYNVLLPFKKSFLDEQFAITKEKSGNFL